MHSLSPNSSCPGSKAQILISPVPISRITEYTPLQSINSRQISHVVHRAGTFSIDRWVLAPKTWWYTEVIPYLTRKRKKKAEASPFYLFLSRKIESTYVEETKEVKWKVGAVTKCEIFNVTSHISSAVDLFEQDYLHTVDTNGRLLTWFTTLYPL